MAQLSPKITFAYFITRCKKLYKKKRRHCIITVRVKQTNSLLKIVLTKYFNDDVSTVRDWNPALEKMADVNCLLFFFAFSEENITILSENVRFFCPIIEI